MTGETPGPALCTTRWFHPKKPLSEALRETLLKIRSSRADASGEIHVATSRAEMAVARRQGSEPAVLMTAGFETWAKLGPRSMPASPGLRTERAWFPTSTDKIFGVDEHIAADGVVAKPLKLDELDALIAKLELLKTKEIAIAFLNADRFPEHERSAAAFLRERGYRVTASHELPGASAFTDVERVRRAVESAFAEAVVQDDLASLRAVLEADGFADNWTIRFWTSEGLGDPSAALTSSASFVRGGVETALAHAIPAETELGYFFGLEEFLGFRKQTDGRLETYLLPVQPTSQIGVSSWAFPSWSSVDRGYEPGPMLFGKSHQLTLLDVLFVRDRLTGDIDGFSDRVQTKSSPRILEALFTLGKNLAEPGRRAADAKDIAEDLERSFVERLSMDLAFNSRQSTRVFVAGPLAPSLLPLLEARRGDFKFVLDPVLSVASAALASSATASSASVKGSPRG